MSSASGQNNFTPLEKSVLVQFGFSLRNLCVLCVSAVNFGLTNRGDAEDAEITQRVE